MNQLRSMKLHGQFGRDTDNKKSGKSWHWLKNGNLKQETESLQSAAQERALNNNSVRKTYHKNASNKCMLCGTHAENVLHIVSSFSLLAQKEYKRRPDKVCLNIHWALCKKYVKGGTSIRLSLSLKMILSKFYGMSVFKWIDKQNIGGQILWLWKIIRKNV